MANKEIIDYDQHLLVEIAFLKKVIREKNYEIIKKHNITEDYFFMTLTQELPFVSAPTKTIFKFIMNYYNAHKELPTEMVVCREFPAIGDPDTSKCDADFDYLVNDLIDYKLDREFCEMIQTVYNIYSIEKDTRKAISYARDSFTNYSITSNYKDVDLFREGLDEFVANYEEACKNPNKAIMSTGFKDLDSVIGGFHREGELAVIQGKMGSGKSFALQKMAIEAGLSGENVCYFDPEMTQEDATIRQISLNTNPHISSFALSMKYDSQLTELKAHRQEFRNKDGIGYLHYLNSNSFNGVPTVSKLRAYCDEKKITALYIDGLSYIVDEKAQRDTPNYMKLGHVCSDLLTLSRDMKIPVIVVVQAQRLGKDEELDNSTISGSIEIPRIATLVISMTSKDIDKVKQVVFKIDKNRLGNDKGQVVYEVEYDKNAWWHTQTIGGVIDNHTQGLIQATT